MRPPWELLALGALALLTAGGGYVMATNRKTGARWNRLLPAARAAAEKLEAAARAEGLNVMFFDGWRSPEESARNYVAGTSRLSDPYNSYHVWGAALDVAFVNAAGLPTWLEDSSKPKGWVDPRWKQLAAIGQRLGLYSGGINWGWDWGHFQLPGYSVSALRAKYGNDYLAFLAQAGVAVA
jgi:hypothetical protein